MSLIYEVWTPIDGINHKFKSSTKHQWSFGSWYMLIDLNHFLVES